MKNRGFLRLVCLALCALMLAAGASGAGAATLTMPEKLAIVDESAFEGTAAENIVLKDNTQRIESRAFAQSGAKTVYIPESVTFIADDAFEGCGDVLLTVHEDSYAHKWAAFRHVRHEVIFDAPPVTYTCAVSEPVLFAGEDGEYARVTATTGDEAAILNIRVLDEDDESLILTLSADLSAGLRAQAIDVSMAYALMDMPLTFILEAVITDDEGNALCAPARSVKYTAAYAEFKGSTAEDYAEAYGAARVIDFGESGYAVLAENVIPVSGSAAQDGDRYTFEWTRGDMPRQGDVLMLNVGGVQTPVKVGAAALAKSGEVTVTADASITLSDAYDVLNVDGAMAPEDEASLGVGAGTAFNYEETFKYGENDALTVTVDAGMSIDVVAEYYKKNFGPDHFYFDLEGRVFGNAHATVTGAYNKKIDDITLYSGVVIIPGVNLPATLAVTLPIEADVKGTGNAEVNFEKIIGFSWSSENGAVKKQDPGDNYATADLEVDFSAKAGPRVELDMSLWKIFGACVTADVGVKVNGQFTAQAGVGEKPADEDKRHGCNACLALWANLELSADANIYYHITDEISDDLLAVDLFDLSHEVWRRHCSLINPEDSYYRGEKTWGEGHCPNYCYLCGFTAEDMYGKAVEDLPAAVTHTIAGTSREITAPDKAYIYPGSYKAEGALGERVFSAVFTVKDEPVDVVIREEEATLKVSVLDYDTDMPLGGVAVTLTGAGTSRKLTTDGEGACLFDKLTGGDYTLEFVKKGYETRQLDVSVFPGSSNSVEVSLVGKVLPVLLAESAWGDAGRYQALTADGACPKDAPKVYIDVETEFDFIDTITVTCANSQLSFQPGYSGKMELFGVDLGDGQYTFVLQAAYVGTGGGYEVRVFRVGDDGLEWLMKPSDFADIGVSASFSTDTDFKGTLKPSGRTVSGTMPLPYSGFNRKGNSIGIMGGGSMTYVLNENNYYDLYHHVRCAAGGYNWDNIFSIKTRYVLKNGALTIGDQTVVMYEGGTVTVN